MTTSILNDCLLLKGQPDKPLSEYFKTINVHTFDNIFAKYPGIQGDNTVLFLLCAFDELSPMIVSRQDSVEEKSQICEYLDIPEYQRHNLIYLKDKDIRKAATEYMQQFAGEEFRHLMFMKIQLQDFELDITNREFSTQKITPSKEEGEPDKVEYFYDIKEHGKAISEKERLAKAIYKAEKEMAAKVKLMGIEGMREWKKDAAKKVKSKRGGGLEDLIK